MIVRLAVPIPGVIAWLAAVTPDTGRLAWLDDGERRRAARLADPTGYIAARCTVRRILTAHLGVATLRICRAAGRPALPDHPAMCLSLAYSRDQLAIALADRAIGIDVEHVLHDPADMAVRRHLFHADDPVVETPSAFYRLWTRKEALFKASGDDGTFDPAAVALSDERRALLPDGRGFVCRSLDVTVPALAVAIAVRD